MKLKIGDYVVEVKARREYHKTNSKKVAEAFLYHLACAFWDASHYMENEGYLSLREGYVKEAIDINDFFKQGE